MHPEPVPVWTPLGCCLVAYEENCDTVFFFSLLLIPCVSWTVSRKKITWYILLWQFAAQALSARCEGESSTYCAHSTMKLARYHILQTAVRTPHCWLIHTRHRKAKVNCRRSSHADVCFVSFYVCSRIWHDHGAAVRIGQSELLQHIRLKPIINVRRTSFQGAQNKTKAALVPFTA